MPTQKTIYSQLCDIVEAYPHLLTRYHDDLHKIDRDDVLPMMQAGHELIWLLRESGTHTFWAGHSLVPDEAQRMAANISGGLVAGCEGELLHGGGGLLFRVTCETPATSGTEAMGDVRFIGPVEAMELVQRLPDGGTSGFRNPELDRRWRAFVIHWHRPWVVRNSEESMGLMGLYNMVSGKWWRETFPMDSPAAQQEADRLNGTPAIREAVAA